MQLHTLTFILTLISACNGQNTTPPPHANPPAAGQTQSAGSPRGVPGEDPYFTETQYITSAHGPRSITRGIIQDKSGNVWMATWEGIIRYDETTFTNFTNKDSLRRFHVFSALADRRGILWFGMIGGGVYRYDGHTFTHFSEQDGLAGNHVECILEDRTGNIWFGTSNGLSRYDGTTFTNFSTREGLCDNAVHTLALDRSGKLWVGTDGGVCSFNGQSFSPLHKQSGAAFNNVRTIATGKNGELWIGGNDGLFRYDGAGLFRLTANFTGYVLADRSGGLWINAGEPQSPHMSMYRSDGITLTKLLEKSEPDDHQLFGILEDQSGNIWFGTMQGAYRYDGKTVTCFRE